MRERRALGLIIGGIALSIFGLWWTVFILDAQHRCIEGGFASCVALGFQPFILASGIVLGVAGALLFRRERHRSAPPL